MTPLSSINQIPSGARMSRVNRCVRFTKVGITNARMAVDRCSAYYQQLSSWSWMGLGRLQAKFH